MSEDGLFFFALHFGQKIKPKFSEDLFFYYSPNFGQIGQNLNKDIYFVFFAPRLILGARHRSSYPLEKFLSEALAQGMYNLSLSGLSSTCPERSLSKRWQKFSAVPIELLRDLIYTPGDSNLSYKKQKVASGTFQKALFFA